MKQDEIKKAIIRVTEGNAETNSDAPPQSRKDKIKKLKKPIIFGLMGFVFFGCLYLIFKPSEKSLMDENIGFNNKVPQPTDADMPNDKAKAYEKEMLEQKNEQKRNALSKLSDYWDSEQKAEIEFQMPDEEWTEEQKVDEIDSNAANPSITGYRKVQSSLGSFYRDNDSETASLKEQVRALKEQLSEKDIPPVTTVEEQLALMEKSYEMAAKFYPSSQSIQDDTLQMKGSATPQEEEYFAAFEPEKKNPVSFLPRYIDSYTTGDYTTNNFYGTKSHNTEMKIKNSIKACIHETQKITGDSGIRIRLLESVWTGGVIIPKGTLLTAIAKFQTGRLDLKISSVEWGGNIIAVDISVYDLDGQKGLYVPYSAEMNALSEVAGNMSQTSGTNLMLTNSAGQQIAADLSRGVMQGISGYFSKKVRAPKVTLKAGHQLFLVSEN